MFSFFFLVFLLVISWKFKFKCLKFWVSFFFGFFILIILVLILIFMLLGMFMVFDESIVFIFLFCLLCVLFMEEVSEGVGDCFMKKKFFYSKVLVIWFGLMFCLNWVNGVLK